MINLAHLVKIRPDADQRPPGRYVQLPKEFFLELENYLFWKRHILPNGPERSEIGSLLICLQNHGRNSGVY